MAQGNVERLSSFDEVDVRVLPKPVEDDPASVGRDAFDGVYVRRFSPDKNIGAAGARWLISGSEFGRFPHWRSDGKQLFFTTVTNFRLMAADIDTSKGFRLGAPRRLVDVPPPLIPVGWSLTPDARRFLFITTPNGGRPQPFTVVLNWAAALKR